MDKFLTLQQSMVLRCFGPSAQIGGTLGCARGPGRITIDLDGQTLGRGPDFATALSSAQRRAAELAEAPAGAAG